MPASAEPLFLTLVVQPGPEASPEEVDEAARQVLADVRQLEVESAELLTAGRAPEGTKATEVVTLGAIAVAVLPAVLPKVVDLLQAWALRGQNRTVKFKGKVAGQEIEFEGSAADLKTLLASLPGQAGSPPPASASA